MCVHQSGKINNTLFLRIVVDNDETLCFQHDQKINHKSPIGSPKSPSKWNNNNKIVSKSKKYDAEVVSLISVALSEEKHIPTARLTIRFSMKLFERFESVCSIEGNEPQGILNSSSQWAFPESFWYQTPPINTRSEWLEVQDSISKTQIQLKKLKTCHHCHLTSEGNSQR